MSVEDGSFSGHKIADGIDIFIDVASNHPYCHFCRIRVPAVVALHRSEGNPLHICRECLSKRLSALAEVEVTDEPKIENRTGGSPAI